MTAALLSDGDPQMVGDYRLVGRLGQGGMGVVYLAQTPTGKPVAVKVIRSEWAADSTYRQRFAQEVEAALRVSSPYTARLLHADTDSEQPYLVSEYVPGPTLADHVTQNGPLDGDELIAFAAGLATGLAAIHAAGVVHRDLSPGNVLLTVEGPRIIDLGVAQTEDGTRLTQTGVTFGTPEWIDRKSVV